MNTPRGSFAAVTLSDGDVLVAGGFDSAGQVVTNTAELYDPTTGTWSYTGSMNTPRALFKMTTLSDGDILATGGVSSGNPGNGNAIFNRSAETYDPEAGTWTAVASMHVARADMGQKLLSDGQVLTCGGITSDTNIMTDTCELYNPTANTWTYTGSLPYSSGLGGANDPMFQFASGSLDGSVMVAGGFLDGAIPVNGAELYDPSTGAWTPTGSMNIDRAGFTTTVLTDGGVLAAGGVETSGPTITNSAELYDPSTGTWSTTGAMNEERSRETATLLSDGTVLVSGGYGGGSIPTDTAEVYDPDNDTWSLTGSLPVAVSNSVAVTLSSGQVLVAGGLETATFTPVDDAELYEGPSLSTDAVTLDTTEVSAVSAPRKITFSNRGPRRVWLGARLTGSGRGQFILDSTRCSKELRPGGRCGIRVCLAPHRAGIFMAHLEVVVRGEARLSVLLRGRGRRARRSPRWRISSSRPSPSDYAGARGPDRLVTVC